MRKYRDLTLDEILNRLKYDPATGIFTWLMREDASANVGTWNARFGGRQAFTSSRAGYLGGTINGVKVQAHRLAYFVGKGVWPDCIDHINGDRSDNRLANLRSVTLAENNRNHPVQKRNKSGVPGVRLDIRRNRWRAEVTFDGRVEFLGSFVSLDDAIAARMSAQKAYGFHENHGRRVHTILSRGRA